MGGGKFERELGWVGVTVLRSVLRCYGKWETGCKMVGVMEVIGFIGGGFGKVWGCYGI
jgi:hypothetical protein